MENLIKISDKGLVSAKELYLGLGLNKTNWSRWYPTNIENNGYFEEDVDWIGVRHDDEGNETMDFAISIEFAKHIAMMARTEKSHKYRNYFIKCEQTLKSGQPKQLSAMEQLRLQYQVLEEQDKKIDGVAKEVDDLKVNMPLFNIDCKELQLLVRKTGTKVLGGYGSPAYKNNSLRGKIYSDIQHQLRREFGVNKYEAIKRSQLDTAKRIVEGYKAPIFLMDKIILSNNQVKINEEVI